jgi:hypothetical protein
MPLRQIQIDDNSNFLECIRTSVREAESRKAPELQVKQYGKVLGDAQGFFGDRQPRLRVPSSRSPLFVAYGVLAQRLCDDAIGNGVP